MNVLTVTIVLLLRFSCPAWSLRLHNNGFSSHSREVTEGNQEKTDEIEQKKNYWLEMLRKALRWLKMLRRYSLFIINCRSILNVMFEKNYLKEINFCERITLKLGY